MISIFITGKLPDYKTTTIKSVNNSVKLGSDCDEHRTMNLNINSYSNSFVPYGRIWTQNKKVWLKQNPRSNICN